MTYQLGDLERNILRMISEEEEICGYELWKRMSSKGIKCHSNHLYVVLKDMEKEGILKGRWVERENHSGARKHLYSIGKEGKDVMNSILKDSLSVLMTSYVNEMRQLNDYSGFASVIAQASVQLGLPTPAEDEKIVLSIPYHDPLTCYQLIFSLTDSFPNSSLYLVTPPKMEIYESRPNMTVLHGWRHDMPLKDEFADLVILEGFPYQVSEEETIRECFRVLKEGGNLVVQVKNTMVEEREPEFPFFSEYVEKLYYELFQQDRKISREKVASILQRYFKKQTEANIMGTTVFYGKR